VDGDEHKSIQNPGDENTDAYRRIKETLIKARDANRRGDTWVENLYTMKPKAGAPNTLAYGVDSEESPENRSAVDQALKITKGRTPVLGQPDVDRDDFSTDQYGQWLSANMPVKDRSGNLVAAVGVDLPASFVQGKLDHLKLYSLGCFALAVALGSTFAIAYSAYASRQMEALKSALEK
jgi:hypothetical protein